VADRNLPVVSKILAYQLIIIMITISGFALVGGLREAFSPALGGMAAFIPNVYFALRAFKGAGQEAKKIVRSFYVGEAGKLLLTVALFVLIFQIPTIKILPLLVGYITALSVFWLALLMR
jgi:ATP synthase protein I